MNIIEEYAGGRRDFRGANLHGANLVGANLTRANLTGANLRWANLTDSDLDSATLMNADLTDANLTNAFLSRSDLDGSNLTRANLSGTCLDPTAPCPPISDEEILSAGLRIDGEWIVGYRTVYSIHYGENKYVPGMTYRAPVFSVCKHTACHPGIYFASTEWLGANYPCEPCVRCMALRRDTVHAGGKWRTRTLEVIP